MTQPYPIDPCGPTPPLSEWELQASLQLQPWRDDPASFQERLLISLRASIQLQPLEISIRGRVTF